MVGYGVQGHTYLDFSDVLFDGRGDCVCICPRFSAVLLEPLAAWYSRRKFDHCIPPRELDAIAAAKMISIKVEGTERLDSDAPNLAESRGDWTEALTFIRGRRDSDLFCTWRV